MAGDPDGVDQQLAGKITEVEAVPHRCAFNGHASRRIRQLLVPFGDRCAGLVEQGEPQRHVLRAIAVPIIGRRHSGVQVPATAVRRVAEPGEIGGEIEWVEILAPIGQAGRIEANLIERHDVGCRRHQMGDVANDLVGVEGDDQQSCDVGRSQIGHRLGHAAEDLLTQRGQVLHIDMGDIGRDHGINLGKGGRKARWVVDRQRAFFG